MEKKTKKQTRKTEPAAPTTAEIKIITASLGAKIVRLERQVEEISTALDAPRADTAGESVASAMERYLKLHLDGMTLPEFLTKKINERFDYFTDSLDQIRTRLLKLEPGNLSNEPGTGSGPTRSLLDELRDIVRLEVAAAAKRDPLSRH
jgi:hypothetical protein